MYSEFLGCLFYVFTIVQAFPSNKLLCNKPDALRDKPINSVASQPNNSVFIYIFNVSLLASLLYIELLFARLCLIFNISLLASLLYIAHLFARHQVALLCAVSNICCHARLCPRAYFCQHRISIPCVSRSMGSFPIPLCRHKVKHLLFSTPTFEIENLVKRRNRTPLPPS